jgi:hypothetical protein
MYIFHFTYACYSYESSYPPCLNYPDDNLGAAEISFVNLFGKLYCVDLSVRRMVVSLFFFH